MLAMATSRPRRWKVLRPLLVFFAEVEDGEVPLDAVGAEVAEEAEAGLLVGEEEAAEV